MKKKVYHYPLTGGIRKTKEFKKKGLATHAVNVGLTCGHACKYCSTPAMVRAHRAFVDIGKSAFTEGLVVLDKDTPKRIEKDLGKLTAEDVVQLCTTTDAWSPEAQKHDLGRKCLEALLERSSCTVRILTKNAAVSMDYDLIKRHRDRVLLGLSLTAPPSSSKVVSIIEPNASPIRDRIKAMRKAAKMGLRTYGMVCPCLPDILDSRKNLMEMASILRDCKVEHVWVEPVNARGAGLKKTQKALEENGYGKIAEKIKAIRKGENWSAYTRRLIEVSESVFKRYANKGKLHILLYPSKLTDEDSKALRKCPSVVWL